MGATTVDIELIHRARGEFLEMPGLRLTFQQAQRLWGLDEDTCASLLETLVVSGFLVRSDDEQYARAFDGEPHDAGIRGALSGGRQGQPYRDDRPAFVWGFDGNSPVMCFDEALYGGEAESCAASLGRHER